MTFSRRPLARMNRGRIARFTGRSGPDTVVPAIQSAATNSDGTRVTLTYNENLDPASGSNGTYTLANTASAVASIVSVSGNQVVLATDTPILVSDANINIDYSAGANPLKDLAGNLAANLTDYPVANNVLSATREIFVDTVFASGAYTDHLAGEEVIFDSFDPGGGGDGDNNLTNSASGGGGGHSGVTVASAEASYTITMGTAGAGGLLGTSTAATGNTIAGSGGNILVGGAAGRGISGAVPVAGAGGTGVTGDVHHAGGNGTTSTGAIAGGGGGGSSTAASGLVPGEPDGGASVTASTVTMGESSGGGVSTGGAVAANGGDPRVVVTARRAVITGYPYTPSKIKKGRDTANALIRNFEMPDNLVSNDAVLLIGAVDGDTTTTLDSGWTKFADIANTGADVRLVVAAKDYTGTEVLTWDTAASERVNWVAVPIRGAKPVADWDLTTVSGTGAMDPPSHTHLAGSKPILWFCGGAWDQAVNTNSADISAFPTGFSHRYLLPVQNVGAGVGIAICARRETTDIKNPGAFTMNNRNNRSFTLAIPLLGS